MHVHTSLALALVNATASAISSADKAKARPHWVALRVADRVDRNDRAGTTRVQSVSVHVSRKTKEKIQREQKVVV
jgi:hypothetical protein